MPGLACGALSGAHFEPGLFPARLFLFRRFPGHLVPDTAAVHPVAEEPGDFREDPELVIVRVVVPERLDLQDLVPEIMGYPERIVDRVFCPDDPDEHDRLVQDPDQVEGELGLIEPPDPVALRPEDPDRLQHHRPDVLPPAPGPERCRCLRGVPCTILCSAGLPGRDRVLAGAMFAGIILLHGSFLLVPGHAHPLKGHHPDVPPPITSRAASCALMAVHMVSFIIPCGSVRSLQRDHPPLPVAAGTGSFTGRLPAPPGSTCS